MPARTREAMLEGIGKNEIIVGAYTDRKGRVCPMLAAHRHGGRTSLSSFARAWDRYTGASRRPRPATEREVRTLRAMLEASLIYEVDSELAAAATDHRASLERNHEAAAAERKRRRVPTGETSRLGELKGRAGWSWLRVFRRYDDYAAALAQVESEERAAAHEDSKELENA
ncbi:MAG: hypothetical protein QOC95_1581 [Thermoleophilaceae bacterium]|jgi:hypothetical protein|nr:hypothetical protein [Thermoleophilaceae bacterium]